MPNMDSLQPFNVRPALIMNSDSVSEIKSVVEISAASPGTQTVLSSGGSVTSSSAALAAESDTKVIVCKVRNKVPKSGTIFYTLQYGQTTFSLNVTLTSGGWAPPSLILDTVFYPITADFDISTVTWSTLGSLTLGSSSGFSGPRLTPNLGVGSWSVPSSPTGSVVAAYGGTTPQSIKYTNPSFSNAIDIYGLVIKVKPTAPFGLGVGATLVNVSAGLRWDYTNSSTSRFTRYRGWSVQ